ncbi:MAG TPA: hypothetical protein VMB25_15150 [Bryobacteraceae bacterium]|nr:hypothetical protein [Bryobacteraceae bacterium]
MDNPTGDVRECLQAARTGMREIKQLLSQPSAEMVDQAVALLREVEVHLGCVAALLKQNGARPAALEIRTEVEDLQEEVAVLARFLARADQMLAGWLQGVRTRRGGYTERGQAAPLVLVKKLTVQG